MASFSNLAVCSNLSGTYSRQLAAATRLISWVNVRASVAEARLHSSGDTHSSNLFQHALQTARARAALADSAQDDLTVDEVHEATVHSDNAAASPSDSEQQGSSL